MDYEFRIKLAKRELAHLNELQAIQRAYLDTHDQTEQKLQNLIDILAREHANGRSQG